jgi:DNA topoisomerase-3
VLPASLTSAKLTAQWEEKLLGVQRGELTADEFMSGIEAFIKAIVLENNKPNPKFVSLFPNEKNNAAPPLGKCPRCNSDVREGRRGYFCDSRACEFKLWKSSKFWTAKRCELTPAIVAALLMAGRVKVSGLYSEKTGKTYDATVILKDTGGKFVDFDMEFAPRKGKR